MGGGDAVAWSTKMRTNVTEIINTTSNFRSYIAPDYKHCIIPYPELYTVTSNGVKLIDWIRNAVDDKPVDNVDCMPNCGAPKP